MDVKQHFNQPAVPQTLYNSATARAHSAKSTGRTSNAATTGHWATNWKRDSSHTSTSTMTKMGDRRHQVVTSSPVSLAGPITSIIFVATNVLSRQTCVCPDKARLVAKKHVFCRDKSMLVATKLCLSRQNLSCDKYLS